MKIKILNVLTVGLVTLAVLSPGIAVFNLIWGKHIELVKTQNLSCEVHTINKDAQPSQFIASKELSNHNFLHQLQIVPKQYKFTTILQWLFLGIPISIGLGIIGYDRYLVYRAAIWRKQVEMLEKLWQESI